MGSPGGIIPRFRIPGGPVSTAGLALSCHPVLPSPPGLQLPSPLSSLSFPFRSSCFCSGSRRGAAGLGWRRGCLAGFVLACPRSPQTHVGKCPMSERSCSAKKCLVEERAEWDRRGGFLRDGASLRGTAWFWKAGAGAGAAQAAPALLPQHPEAGAASRAPNWLYLGEKSHGGCSPLPGPSPRSPPPLPPM